MVHQGSFRPVISSILFQIAFFGGISENNGTFEYLSHHCEWVRFTLLVLIATESDGTNPACSCLESGIALMPHKIRIEQSTQFPDISKNGIRQIFAGKVPVSSH